jgi:hypothetical protein
MTHDRGINGCAGKIGYETKADAEKARRYLYEQRDYGKKGGGREATVMSVYHCPCCAKHHIGRSTRAGLKGAKHTPSHRRDSLRNRYARYRELTKS